MPLPKIVGGLARWSREALDQWERDNFPRTAPPPDDVLDEVLRALHAEACQPVAQPDDEK